MQRAGVDRRPRPAGRGSVLGVSSRPAPPRRHGSMPGRPPPAGDTHLRRRHPARPVRSSGNSARLLSRPPVPGRGRRPERTNHRWPPTLAANGSLPSERSGGIPPPNLGLPPLRALSGPILLGLNGGGLNHCGAARVGGRETGRELAVRVR